jgi:hypothetical protein
MSEAPALRHASLASSSSAGWALIGPGGSVSFAAEPAVDDFPGVEVPRLAVFDGPELHPGTASDRATRTVLTRRERDVLRLLASRLRYRSLGLGPIMLSLVQVVVSDERQHLRPGHARPVELAVQAKIFSERMQLFLGVRVRPCHGCGHAYVMAFGFWPPYIQM